MDKTIAKEAILKAKLETGETWDSLGKAINMSPVWLASACLGMNSMPEDKAQAICEILGLNSELVPILSACPHKTWDKAVPTDPLIYRLYEIVGVYGETLKSVIHEKFGDGIMSAIDFSMDVEKEENPKGDRVVITMNGKFLPYKSW
ncbi:cyanate lyase [Oleiphilus messinensis]|uniref:Cyanate hydratase n=1 Tax=Oleiphilus messinensis TaxID=141451 RepID=A0A1Y0I6Q9_9GAMM|nr:cyanase [Oleiphilus messinensis]ARU55466.1 cyanate lyase [Oleiphilus messinensis]